MKDSELKLLRDKCLLFNQFMHERRPLPPEQYVSREEAIRLIKETYEETNRLVENAYQEHNPKPLKVMNADIDDQVLRHMPLQMATEFKALLKEKLNIDYDVIDKKRMRTIERVLKRGKIANREEWEIVTNRVDEIFADNTKGEELKNLNELLLKYENGNKK